ncbi:ABC transporter permease subunit [Streptomyces sp. NBC_01353]|uniref:ABC transporter permease subunit n=1 Tax=Streptomyces sp. NBC_01353 TaxID=2903835 RepID=UPI002E325230|nr:ABC transporter permease subunit [Streptomyces sp. NBC_01353]
MTTTLTPRPPATRRVERGGFLAALHAEWTKFRTVRGWVLAMAAALLATIVVGLLGTAAPAPSGPGTGTASYPKGPGGEAVNDNFYLVHKKLTGDGSLTVDLRSLTGVADTGIGREPAEGAQPWAKAGIVMKASLTRGSPYAAVMATGGHGVRMQYGFTHDTAGPSGKVSEDSPRRLRLVRSGDSLTGYVSTDGSHWTEVDSVKLPGLPQTVQAGFFAASPQAMQETAAGAGFSPAAATGTFGAPELTGSWTPGAWNGTQVGGDAGTSGSYSNTIKGGFTQTGGEFIVTGAGDIAPVVGGPVMGGGFSVENFLVGTFAGLIVVIAVGTVFITGEYRHGLLRTTVAAVPPRGRVLGAKALVVGGVGFTIGLVAAAITIPIGKSSALGRGFHVFPVPAATELRVMAGTGLLCAAAAVLALGVGTLLRRSATAVALVIASIVLPFLLATSGVLPSGVSEWLLRVTPAAGFAVQQTLPHYTQVLSVYEPSTGYYPLTPWTGFAVLCGYAALAFGLAVVRLRRRDV